MWSEQAYVVGLLVLGFVVVFGLWQCRRIVILRTRGLVAPAKDGPGLWVEFEVPDVKGTFKCHHTHAALAADKLVVVYDPRNPKVCDLKDDAHGWPMVVSLLVVSLAALWGCLALISAMIG